MTGILFKRITIKNVAHGAFVINRSIYESRGVKSCDLGEIVGIIITRGVLKSINVKWRSTGRTYSYRPEMFLIKPKVKTKLAWKPTDMNPNISFMILKEKRRETT
jgi:hypothetical protein